MPSTELKNEGPRPSRTGACMAAVALLGLLAATLLGTFIVQGYPAEALAQKYPSSTGFLRSAGIDDVFHSLAFRSLLGLLALSVVLAGIQKRAWRLSDAPLGAGLLAVLVGGLLATLSGQRGILDVHKGEVVRQFALCDRQGHPSGKTVALDFGLKLDKLEIDRVPLEFRFYVYRKDERGWTPENSRSLDEALEWAPAGASGRSYRLLIAYPEFEQRPELREVPEGSGHPALQVETVDREGTTKTEVLLAGVEGRDEIVFKGGKTRLAFAWTESQVKVSTDMSPERHVLHVRRGGTASRDEVIVVQPGGKYPVAGGEELTVEQWYPDFFFDSETKSPSSKSGDPNNPALRISVRDQAGRKSESFAFANDKGFAGPNGTPIGDVMVSYRFEPPREAADREVVLLGSTRELLDYRKGILTERHPFTAREGEQILKGISALFQRMSPSGDVVQTPLTLSKNWRKPVAQVEIRTGTAVETHFLKGAMPFDLGGGTEVLVFQPKPEEVMALRSRVSIVSGERTMLQDSIEVNHPISYGGYRFHQVNSHPQDTTSSGILVVKAPGLWTLYAGLVLTCLGAVLGFFAGRARG